jgi:hypothetical protein
MIDDAMIHAKYSSGEALIQKLDSCEYCPFEAILKPEQRKIKILYMDIPEGNHPHRRVIEEICGLEKDEVCHMKYAAMRMHINDFMLAQIGAVEIFKLDLGKAYQRPIANEEAWLGWTKKNSDIFEESYAIRFREIWDRSIDVAKKQTLTKEGLYRIVMADQKTYDAQIKVFELLDKEERNRDKNGINN